MSADISTREGLFAVMRQHAAEREAAKPIVAELLQREELPWDEPIPEEWRTAGFVEELTKGAIASADANPPRGIDLLHLALAIAASTALADSVLFDYVNGVAWKEAAWIHAYQGTLDVANEALNNAVGLVDRRPGLVAERAAIGLRRAGLFAYLGRYDEAHAIVKNAIEVFRDVSDRRCLVIADLITGVIEQCRGDYRSARAIYEGMRDNLPADVDPYTAGSLYNNLACVLVLDRAADEAVRAIEQARQFYAKVGVPAHKADWSLARVHVLRGDLDSAEKLLWELRRTFVAHEARTIAALVGLNLVELMIAESRMEEADRLFEQVTTELRYTTLTDGAVVALKSLGQHLKDRTVSRATAKHAVREVGRTASPGEELLLPLPD